MYVMQSQRQSTASVPQSMHCFVLMILFLSHNDMAEWASISSV